MKNLITITSILAAGTLCANAVTTFTIGNKEYDIGSWTTVTPVATSLSTGNTALVTSSLTDSWMVSFTLTCTNTTSTDVDKIFSLNNNGNPTGNIFAYTPNTGTVSFYQSASADTPWGFTITGVNSGDTLSLGWIEVSSTQGFFFMSSGTKLATSSVVTVSNLVSQKVSLENVARLWAGTETFSNIAVSSAGTATAKTIPEPSMFGVLAGTLALGLAGTRRRRR